MMSLFWMWLSLEHVEDMTDVSTEFSFDSVIQGHHIYKKVWTTSVGEVLLFVKEEANEHDHFTISVMKDGFIVGHEYCLLIIHQSLNKKEFWQMCALNKQHVLNNHMHLTTSKYSRLWKWLILNNKGGACVLILLGQDT